MKIKITIENDEPKIVKGDVKFNFTAEELEKLLNELLDGTATFEGLSTNEYEKYKDHPEVELIYGIYNSTLDDSDFRKQLKELENEKANNEKQLDELISVEENK
ncbi:MAG: hypothetical protein PHF21_00170 [Bacilli bacterium]|nr:hypothetical protein [Bacilli bacterium]